jgi:hypothetical protein
LVKVAVAATPAGAARAVAFAADHDAPACYGRALREVFLRRRCTEGVPEDLHVGDPRAERR